MANYLPEALQSVLHGTFSNLEVIVVDDGSTDDTRSIVKSFTTAGSPRFDGRVQYLHQSNQGKAAAVNRGLKKVRGTYVTVLDADDRIPKNSLQVRCDALGQTKTSLVIGGFEVFDNEGNTKGWRQVPIGHSPSALYRQFFLWPQSPFSLNTCLIPMELVNRVGSFDERLYRCQDIDYSLRLLREATAIEWVNTVVYSYRKHRSSYRNRMKVRLSTMQHRPLVYWKNYESPLRYFAVLCGLLLDAGKLLFEISGNYEQ
jgi:glycosyltransferase involved in cell wall biosynthesis